MALAKPSIFTNFFTILFILLLAATNPSHSNNQTDFEALLAFKKSIHDDPLGALRSWNETTHFCSWNGVSCGTRHPNRVVSLSLRSQGLVGSLSPHIGNLSFLRTIILQNNSFRGPIPEEIGRLKRVEKIIFSNNSFGGGIPTNISQCSNLYRLDLINNQLTGGIIPEIASLVKLDNLALTKNMLSGIIPPFLGNLTNLSTLSLAYCGLHGQIPESLVQLRRMKWLILYANNLTGQIPSGLYNLSSMEIFELGENQLHGAIPSFTLPKLIMFNVAPNLLTGLLPVSLLNSSLIEEIYLYSNNFTGEMFDLTRLPALLVLGVSENHLEGDIDTIISSATNCTQLQVLELHTNLFTGLLPDSIGNLSINLFLLDISLNQISGSIPSTIGNLIGLTVLIADVNNLEGPIPSSIGKLDQLQKLTITENRLSDEVPSSFGNLTLLNELLLRRNNLVGSIPQSLGNCTNLEKLDLSENNLNGTIPPEILRLSSISIALFLSHNFLTGTIPSEVDALRNLGWLDLSHNRLSGFIPTSLSRCVSLERLHLGSNSLQGEIPDSLRALSGLEYLDLSQNNISGKIPTFLVDFHLLYLNLSFNPLLQGEVPTLGVFQNQSAISLQGDDQLCGGIPILNLTSCPLPNSNKKLDLGKIWIPIAGGSLVLSALCLCVIIYRRRTSQKVGAPASIFMVPEFLRLTYADLLKATGGFSESNLVGAGRFGSVYKGSIINDDEDEQKDVAVKVLNINIRGAYKSLATECNALRSIRHRNLLKIISVCDSIDFQENDFKALVYEFMANGSLESWLHQNSLEQGRNLNIIQRLDIAIDIASGVEYLHGGTDCVVIHGDLKPSNILLDQGMVAHVGDFGLAKIISSISQNLSSTEGSSSIAVKGTMGYIPPEYGMNNVVSTQGDAYSYGIFVLEMCTNIRPTSDSLEGCTTLPDFVSNALPNSITEVVDPFLHDEINKGDKYVDCIVSLLRIGIRCSMELPRDRLSMAQVVSELKKIKTVFVTDTQGRNVAP